MDITSAAAPFMFMCALLQEKFFLESSSATCAAGRRNSSVELEDTRGERGAPLQKHDGRTRAWGKDKRKNTDRAQAIGGLVYVTLFLGWWKKLHWLLAPMIVFKVRNA